jgi:hypothetical protein
MESMHRWLFIWRDLTDPVEVDRMVERFPRAQAAGFNGVVFPAKLPPAKPREIKAAADRYSLALIPVIMGRSMDQNYSEGLPCREAPFIARNGVLVFQPDNPTRVLNGGFEETSEEGLRDWTTNCDAGEHIFAEHEIVHGGETSVRFHPQGVRCSLSQRVQVQPFRQYRASVWIRTENAQPRRGGLGICITDPVSGRRLSFQHTLTKRFEDWTRHHVVFNPLEHREALIWLGVHHAGQSGRTWIDDFSLEEIALVNVLRRPGCPVVVKGENGVAYKEGRDYEPIVDPRLQVRNVYHQPPVVRLTPGTRIQEGERVRISYYHPVMIYDFKNSGCLSEPAIFDEWRKQVTGLRDLFQPPAYFMDFDEVRMANRCALCESRGMTPGELLADHLRRSSQIIREVHPGAEIWMWQDMVDPMHNARDGYYHCQGTMRGSWEGVDPDVGLVNWAGDLLGANCGFFAERGLRQILSDGVDGDQDGALIVEWIKRTRELHGIAGVMYCTWEDRYETMETWAAQAFPALEGIEPPRPSGVEEWSPPPSDPPAALL